MTSNAPLMSAGDVKQTSSWYFEIFICNLENNLNNIYVKECWRHLRPKSRRNTTPSSLSLLSPLSAAARYLAIQLWLIWNYFAGVQKASGTACHGEFKFPSGCSGLQCDYSVEWTLDSDKDEVRFRVQTRFPDKWTGIAFSKDEKMARSDAVIGWVEKTGRFYIYDAWVSFVWVFFSFLSYLLSYKFFDLHLLPLNDRPTQTAPCFKSIP